MIPDVNWREEFAKAGPTQVRENLSNGAIYNVEAKRNCARQGLREQEGVRDLREQRIYSYTRSTFWAAVAAVLVGIIGIVVTLLH